MDLNKAIEVLSKVTDNQKARVKRGLIKRKLMADAIERGEEISGPRAEWLRSTAQTIVGVLADKASEFNEANLDDLISTADMCDALLTTINWLKSASEQIGKPKA